MRIAVAISALILMSAPAFAQREARNYGRPEQTPENLAAMALKGSSFCAMKSASATAEKVLRSPIASDEEAKLVKTLRTVARQCYQPQWSAFSATAVRNALAEIEYRQQFRVRPASTAANSAPPSSFAVVPAGTTGRPEQETAWYLAALSNCVVFADSFDSHNLIAGPANVPEEQKRFDVLKPAIARCASADTVAKLTPRVLRGFIANALLDQSRLNSVVKPK